MIDWQIIHKDVCASTNDEAQKAAPYCVIYTDRQTNGRGRMGRSWHDGQGNLMASIVLPKPENAPLYAFLISLAVAQSLAFLSPRLKWPNDVLIDGKKVCGILLETFEDSLIIGVGVNIISCPDKGMLYPTTCLKNYEAQTTPQILLESILQNFNFVIHSFQKKGFKPVRHDWLEFACGLDKSISVHLPCKTIEGIFKGIDDSGALILETSDKKLQCVTAGDVFLIE